MGQSSVEDSGDGISKGSVISVYVLMRDQTVLDVPCYQSIKTFGNHRC